VAGGKEVNLCLRPICEHGKQQERGHTTAKVH